MSILVEIWRLLNREQRRRVIALQALSILMALSTLTGLAAVVPFFTMLADPGSMHRNAVLNWIFEHSPPQLREDARFAVVLGAGFVLVVLVSNAINFLGLRAIGRSAFAISAEFASVLFREYLERDYEFHVRNDSTELANKILHDAGRTTAGIMQSALILTTNSLTIVFIIASIVLLNPLLAVAASMLLVASYGVIYLFARRRLIRNGRVENRIQIERTKVVGDTFAGIKEVMVSRSQRFFLEKFARSSRAMEDALASTQSIAQSPRYAIEVLMVAGLVGTAVFLSGASASVPWLAQLSFVAFAGYRLLPTLQQMFAALAMIRAHRDRFAAIASDLNAARLRPQADIVPVVASGSAPRTAIVLNDVSFRYEPHRAPALDGVSLRIPAGTVVGLVGPNGSGKTTLADVLAGLLVPTSGSVEVDGERLTEANRAAWQTRIAYVPQALLLLDASIRENIALGVPPSEIDEERLVRAARLAELEELIQKLPGGYGHVLGERGSRLSGGQRQRIGIARALYRNASVLILDEATSSLDGSTETDVMERLLKLRGACTLIVIAHRLHSLRACDALIELDRGRIKNSGTYDALFETSATFRRAAGATRASTQ